MKPISDTYYSSISHIPLLTREQEQELGKAVHGKSKAKADKAINTLILSNLRLVAKIVSKDFPYFSDPEDLMSEGVIGLHRAATKFDPSFGAKFSTYAVWWIRQHIIAHIERASTIRLSNHTHEMMTRIRRVSEKLGAELGYEPTNEELSDATGLSVEMLEKYSGYKYSMIPIDSPAWSRDGEDGSTLADTLEDLDAIRPDAAADTSSTAKVVEELLPCLNSREKEILTYRFGLNGGEAMILEDIGKKYSVTRERIRQIQDGALKKLKKKLMKKSVESSPALAYS
jgi:RNA polymerase sigma factor (sigma-70 family)